MFLVIVNITKFIQVIHLVINEIRIMKITQLLISDSSEMSFKMSSQLIVSIVKIHKMKWCGHVSRPTRLAETVLQGYGKRKEEKRKRERENFEKITSRPRWVCK